MQIRLDKFLADCGYGTRTTVKQIIKGKRVAINGELAKKPDQKVDIENDEVRVDNCVVSYNVFEYYMINKPQGVISAANDDKQKTVVDLISVKKRRDLFPVGRLDKDTEGLIIITNDGPLCNRLLAPGKHVEKKYFAIVRGQVDENDVELFKNGVDIGDEKLTKEAILTILNVYEEKNESSDDDANEDVVFSEIELIITEGRYHQVKRMFEAVGKEVTYLKRLSMGPIVLDDKLEPGEFRKLTEDELNSIL